MSYGLMNIMVYGSIFNGFRQSIHNWGNNEYAPFQYLGKFLSGLISCPLCFSTWGGFFLGMVIFSPTYLLFGVNQNISWFFDGITSAGAVWAINAIIEWFEENRPPKVEYYQEPENEQEILND
jgi:energy-coupling factor transporter transmembrane protein EcfT